MTSYDKAKRRRRLNEPTVADVAAAAHVSKATAARVLGGYGPVSDEVRLRVVAAAEALGYRPNRLARSMSSGRTRTIGVVVGDIQLPFFAGAVRGITDIVQAEGWEVVLANTNEDPSHERNAVRVMFEKRVDGLIVAPASSEEGDHLNQLVNRGLPVVLLDRRARGVAADAVVVDSEAAVERAVRYLAHLGHERIAVVGNTGPTALPIGLERARPNTSDAARSKMLSELKPSIARYWGYFDGLQAAGIAVDPDLVRRTEYTRDSAAVHTLAVLMRSRPATAIITTDSLMTLGVLDAVRHSGLKMPDDLSLIGFDDAEWATVTVPTLTVIAQPVLELGATAGRLLLARIRGEEGRPETVVLETRLIQRESTASPRAPRDGVADNPAASTTSELTQAL